MGSNRRIADEPPRNRAEQVFANCFTKEELEFLKQRPQFVEAVRNIESLSGTLTAVELGERLIRETWDMGGEDSRFTPKDL